MPKRKSPTPSAREPRRSDPADRVIDAALELAASNPWHRLSLHQIAAAAGLGLAELNRLFASKPAILAGFSRRIDGQVLETPASSGAEESARDRLFEVLMRRFDVLKPYKESVAAIARDSRADPVGALCSAPQLLRSMSWMLEAAGISSAGLGGALRAKGLAAIYMATFRVWLKDDSEDMSKTMAALDKRLGRAEAWIERLCGWRRPAEGAETVAAD